MVRRRSTVRFRKGARRSKQYFEANSHSYLSLRGICLWRRSIANAAQAGHPRGIIDHLLSNLIRQPAVLVDREEASPTLISPTRSGFENCLPYCPCHPTHPHLHPCHTPPHFPSPPHPH